MQTTMPVSTITGSFLEQTRAILPFAKDNEIIDNCIADTISGCSSLAIQKKIDTEPSVDACNEYADPVARQNCQNDAYPKIAIFKDDAAVCSQATDEYSQKYCSDTYHAEKSVRNRDVSWCSRLSSADRQNECRSVFYVKVAVDTNDIGFCAKSKDATSQLNCSRSFAMQKMDFTSLESCKKTYAYSSSIPEKGELDRIHRDCLNRLSGNLLAAISANPELSDAKRETYRQVCSVFQELEKKVCLEQLATVQSGSAPLPALPQEPFTGSGNLAGSGSAPTLSGSTSPAPAK